MAHEKFLFNSLIPKSTVHTQSEAEYRSLCRIKDEKNYEVVDTGMWCPYSLWTTQQKATMNSCLEYLDNSIATCSQVQKKSRANKQNP